MSDKITITATLPQALNSKLVTIRNNRKLNLCEYMEHPDTNERSTQRSRPTVFFIHGSMANYQQFDHLISNLYKDYNIVAWDAYGCGGSEKPQGWEEYSADEHLEDVKAIVQKYKSSTNHLICHR
jgi:pimeloyl-ACP methyl ester carboxylesterase